MSQDYRGGKGHLVEWRDRETLIEDNKRLEAENARLREELTRSGITALHERLSTLEAAIEEARLKGMEEGITLYAWWKDGIQYVGTTGQTLKQALAEVRKRDGE